MPGAAHVERLAAVPGRGAVPGEIRFDAAALEKYLILEPTGQQSGAADGLGRALWEPPAFVCGCDEE